MASKATFTEKDARKYRKSLESLVKTVRDSVSYLDMIGKATKDNDTGKAIATVCNKLEYDSDFVRHFTLGQSLKPKRSAR